MTVKGYIKKILKKYRWLLTAFVVTYLFAWGYSYWAGTIDNERPTLIITIAKFIAISIVLFLPSLIIFVDSLHRSTYAGGYVVAGVFFNLYALAFYWLKRKKKRDKAECPKDQDTE